MSRLLVGKEAPNFFTKAVIDGQIVDFSLQDMLGKYVVLLFYPLDFTFVCPTELHAFQEKREAFLSRGAEVLACSVDSCYSHYAWLSTAKSKGGIAGIQYPLLSDMTRSISASYHVLDDKASLAYRGLFIIDPEGVIRYQVINDLPIGRSVEETLRVLDALLFHKEHGEVCPANWEKGQKTMKPTQEGVVDFFS